MGTEPGKSRQVYVVPVEGGIPRTLSPEDRMTQIPVGRRTDVLWPLARSRILNPTTPAGSSSLI
jgi:hypothetical protein